MPQSTGLHIPPLARVALVAAAVFAALSPASVRAECESGVRQLSERIAGVSDPRVKAQLQTDLHGAEVELWEMDEEECQSYLAHAGQLLAAVPTGRIAPAEAKQP